MVNKKEDRQYTYRSSDTGYVHRSGQEVAYYTIDVINGGKQRLEAVEINWYVVVNPAATSKNKAPVVIQGSKKTSLDSGQKFSFQTDVLELGSVSYSSYSGTRTGAKAQVVGHLIEVLVNGKVVRSDSKPLDIKTQIDQLKKQAPPTEPRRHEWR
jgi:hypothetical protein